MTAQITAITPGGRVIVMTQFQELEDARLGGCWLALWVPSTGVFVIIKEDRADCLTEPAQVMGRVGTCRKY